jgi:DNA-binding protein
LTLKAQGKSITKAVTVAEILKRRLEGSLHQFTEIGQITEQEVWDPNPDQPSLDPITISKHRPTIRIRLSKDLPTAPSSNSTTTGTGRLDGVDMSMPGANIPRDEHGDGDEDDEADGEGGEAWPGAILDRDAAARRFVGYQAPTGNDIYL